MARENIRYTAGLMNLPLHTEVLFADSMTDSTVWEPMTPGMGGASLANDFFISPPEALIISTTGGTPLPGDIFTAARTFAPTGDQFIRLHTFMFFDPVFVDSIGRIRVKMWDDLVNRDMTVELNVVTGRVRIQTRGGIWIEIPELKDRVVLEQWIKIVVSMDWDKRQYNKLRFNDIEVDLSGIDIGDASLSIDPFRCDVEVEAENVLAAASRCVFDDILITGHNNKADLG